MKEINEPCDMCEGSGKMDTYAGECSDPDCCGYYPDDYEWVQDCWYCGGSGLMKDQEDYNKTESTLVEEGE